MKVWNKIIDESPEPRERGDYPALANLMGGYFHQDYDIISEDPDVIVAVFKGENGQEHIENVVRDIGRFIDAYGESDSHLSEAFTRVFRPEAAISGWNGRTMREALMKAAEILSSDDIPARARP